MRIFRCKNTITSCLKQRFGGSGCECVRETVLEKSILKERERDRARGVSIRAGKAKQRKKKKEKKQNQPSGTGPPCSVLDRFGSVSSKPRHGVKDKATTIRAKPIITTTTTTITPTVPSAALFSRFLPCCVSCVRASVNRPLKCVRIGVK